MLIGISAKTRGGKDLVGDIIRFLELYHNPITFNGTLSTIKTWRNQMTDIEFVMELLKPCYKESNMTKNLPKFLIKKYADKLKDILCLLIGCTREQLEDQIFKETPLGEEWRIWYIQSEWGYKIFGSQEDFESYMKIIEDDGDCIVSSYGNYLPTPRKLLQLVGTQCGRAIIHPNVWINATMTDYRPYGYEKGSTKGVVDVLEDIHFGTLNYPNWIITDVRFPNEAEAIRKRNGILIRIDRPLELRFPKEYEEFLESDYVDFNAFLDLEHDALYSSIIHESETSLDAYKHFDYIIKNPSNKIEDLIEKIKQILIQEKIINW